MTNDVTIKLPGRLTASSMSAEFSNLIANNKAPPYSVCFDFSRLIFSEPSGIAFLSNFVAWLQDLGVEVFFNGHAASNAACRYLDDADFFLQHLGQRISPMSTTRNTTIPLVRYRHDESHFGIRSRLIPWLASRLLVSQGSLSAIQACISEMFNNIADHSGQTIGSFFAQHFPNKNEVQMTVGDFGIGIPVAVANVLPHVSSDAAAIIEASKEGFSSRTTPRNQGIGLHYLLDTVTLRNKGRVTIFSRRGAVRFSEAADGTIRALALQTVAFCPGTVIDVTLRTDTIEDVGENTEDLEW